MDATFERAGAAVRLRSVTYGHAIELPNPLPRFPYNLAKSEAEKALPGRACQDRPPAVSPHRSRRTPSTPAAVLASARARAGPRPATSPS